jgi:hypothetical protein
MRMHPGAKRTALGLAALLVLGWALLAGCSQQERPEAPATMVVPAQLGVNTVDIAAVSATVGQYMSDAGLKADRGRSDLAKGVFVSQRVRCSPNAEERHVAMCVFTANIAPSTSNPTQVAVELRVRTGDLVKFDPKQAGDQIRIEPTLDRMVTVLRAKFGLAEVTQTTSLTF